MGRNPVFGLDNSTVPRLPQEQNSGLTSQDMAQLFIHAYDLIHKSQLMNPILSRLNLGQTLMYYLLKFNLGQELSKCPCKRLFAFFVSTPFMPLFYAPQSWLSQVLLFIWRSR
jgi:hypothetical protein